MAAADYHLAPPPTMVDGLLAVPVDFQDVQATVRFDGAAATGLADATVTYKVGPTAGYPLFDLRQTIDQAWVDGAPLDPGDLAPHDFGDRLVHRPARHRNGAGRRVGPHAPRPIPARHAGLASSAEPTRRPSTWARGTEAALDVRHVRPQRGPLSRGVAAGQPDLGPVLRSTWTSGSSIRWPPTPSSPTAPSPRSGANHWRSVSRPLHPALAAPRDPRQRHGWSQRPSGVLPVSGRRSTIEAWKLAGGPDDLTARIADIKTPATDNENDYGPYSTTGSWRSSTARRHGVRGRHDDLESARCCHETFHSWLRAGSSRPVQADGWWDEGFTSFHDDGADDASRSTSPTRRCVLCSRDPWQRHTPSNSYADGSALLPGWRRCSASGSLNTLMGDLYDCADRGDAGVHRR